MQTSRANRTPFGVRRQAHQRKKSLQSCCSAAGHTDEARKPKIVGLGSVGLDYLAQVAAFPKPDEKLRTKQMETRGGGNCANALTAAARLGLEPHLVSKVGADSIGEEIEQELLSDGVQTNFLLKATDHPSPFTYIIVDKQGGTRTCIHTPGASYAPEDLDQDTIDRILSNAQLAYFDGRLTESAVVLARAARKRGIPVLVEAERLRPTLEVLLQEADYVCTSAHFPQQWTGEASLGDALHTTLQRLPNVKWMVTTLGKKGSVLLERCPDQAATAAAAQAASAEASANADPSNAASYGTQNGESTVVDGALVAKMTVASAASLPQEAIEDTTGAGDAFIGTVLYAVTQGMPRDKMLKLAAVVAACKCTALGARPGLPYAQDISPELLNA
ncbi:MAG: carbohydrate kinase [Trebouxia sp. A1-2]|nr:MAG: carbohydrate kinase [Trebouxia sp. A1-2]